MVASDVAADDAIAEPSAAQDVREGFFDALILVVPSVPVVAHPGDRRGVERRETLRDESTGRPSRG